ncbi:MAG: restriction endonuclease subunit S, partial [Ruminococcus sp.]|nr:restriction endonuclease subunit S [Ruminococcus sp.]
MREMKDSGIEWIGKIPENWKVIRNKNTFFCTKNLVGTDSANTQLLSLTTKGIKKKDINNSEGKLPESYDTYQYVRKDDIVMCLFDLDCSAVFSGISYYNGMISPAYKILTCTDRIFPKYASYWFNYISDGRKFNHYSKNIRYTLSYEEFSALPILYPDIEEQKAISAYLDDKCTKIDTIIEKQQKIIEKLKAYKLSLITETVTKGLNPDVKMKDSGIEWIGEINDTYFITKIG